MVFSLHTLCAFISAGLLQAGRPPKRQARAAARTLLPPWPSRRPLRAAAQCPRRPSLALPLALAQAGTPRRRAMRRTRGARRQSSRPRPGARRASCRRNPGCGLPPLLLLLPHAPQAPPAPQHPPQCRRRGRRSAWLRSCVPASPRGKLCTRVAPHLPWA